LCKLRAPACGRQVRDLVAFFAEIYVATKTLRHKKPQRKIAIEEQCVCNENLSNSYQLPSPLVKNKLSLSKYCLTPLLEVSLQRFLRQVNRSKHWKRENCKPLQTHLSGIF
jgi:hypothetical protein